MKKIKKSIPEPMQYAAKKSFFSAKEIIFRSNGRAKVFTISSKMQVIFLFLVAFAGIWSFYYYHMYRRSDMIIVKKNNELIATRDAYIDLMGDFVTLQGNIADMIKTLDNAKTSELNLGQYQKQAALVEDKIKQITTQVKWINTEKLAEKANINELSLQRDIAVSERDQLREQLEAMQKAVEDIKKAEAEVLERVAKISEKEIGKIKSAVKEINIPLKKKGLYFNALANDKRKGGSGGPYIPEDNSFLQDKEVSEKVSQIFKNVDDLEYYREVMASVPIGKPVWSLWVSSSYGRRTDPFKKTRAYHKGVDLAGRTGNKIKVMAKGKVTRAGTASGYGNLVEVDHGNGFKTKYGHMHKIYVKKGQYVEVGDALGEVGSTGRSTGPHLHYEILYKGHDVDPMPFMKAKLS